MSEPEPWAIAWTPAAVRSLRRLPPRLLPAVVEFVSGPLAGNPMRLTGELRGDLSGLRSAHLGAYRVLIRLDADTRTVYVERVAARSDAYRI